MSRDPSHGSGDWGFSKSLWSPARKPNGTRWAFWETVLTVREGDIVLHLKGKNTKANFVGFSTASSDGFQTSERPPIPGQWGFSKSFYRVLLRDYMEFVAPIRLIDVFKNQNDDLRKYFLANKKRNVSEKRRLFYVIQAGRLQCLNGAYLTQVDAELTNIILHSSYTSLIGSDRSSKLDKEVSTDELLKELRVRV